ncbi:hypothetical protein B0H14DRAFT_3529100 [Mycena olivaceomarginata]|nr:hypothetical protein B0H14DRAFT_3529100 [Mycena olivaceomarginata]
MPPIVRVVSRPPSSAAVSLLAGPQLSPPHSLSLLPTRTGYVAVILYVIIDPDLTIDAGACTVPRSCLSVSDHSRYTTQNDLHDDDHHDGDLPHDARSRKGSRETHHCWENCTGIPTTNGTCPPRPRLPPPPQTAQAQAHTQPTHPPCAHPPPAPPRPSLGLSTASSSSANSGLPQPGGDTDSEMSGGEHTARPGNAHVHAAFHSQSLPMPAVLSAQRAGSDPRAGLLGQSSNAWA